MHPLPIALALLAFALQAVGLGGASLWYDEGFSAWLAAHSPGEIVARTAADIHPPLYYLLLHGWIGLAGRSEYALRFPSVLAAVVAVPLLWHLGRRLLGPRGAGAAALLVAISPLWLWYAREARMYTLVTALGIAGMLVLHAQLLRGPRPILLGALAAINITAIYTHFYAWFLVAAQMAWLVLWRVIDPPEPSLKAVGTKSGLPPWWLLLPLGATFLAYVPWLSFVLNRLGADRSYWQGSLDVGYVATTLLENWSTGHGLEPRLAQPAGLLLGILALLGLLALARRGDGRGALALAVMVALPLLGLLVVSFGRPKYHPRYLMLAAPGFLLALASLADWQAARRARITARLGLAALLLPLLVFSVADAATLLDPPTPKDDWRGVARALEGQNRGEPVVLLSGHAFPIFSYYDEVSQWIPLPDSPTLDTERILGYPDGTSLENALRSAGGVWVVRWQDEVVDPDGVLEQLLQAGGGQRDSSQQFTGIRLEHWGLPAAFEVPPEPRPDIRLDANFGDDLTLLGANVPSMPSPADAGLGLTLFWQARRPLSRDLKVRLAVEDEAGFVWGVLDRRPASYLHPTFRWRPGDPRPAQVRIPLEAGTPPGDYFVQVTVYSEDDPAGLDRLDPAGAPLGKRLRLGPFPVVAARDPWPAPELGMAARRLGVAAHPDIEAVAVELGAAGESEPGQRVPVKLWWRASHQPDQDLDLHLAWRQDGRLLDEGVVVSPGGPAWPTGQWRAGELVLTQTKLRIPAAADPGEAELVAWLASQEEARNPPLVLGVVTVIPATHDFTPPAPRHRQIATFGEIVRLVGYDLGEGVAGQPLEVTIYWQALVPSERPLTAFVHLLDASGRFVAGADAPPLRPSDGWVAEEYVAQPFSLPLHAELDPGRYRLEAGWYDPADPALRRLPVEGEGADRANGRVLLDAVVEVRGGAATLSKRYEPGSAYTQK